MLQKKNQVLLRFLKIRAIVNGKLIYSLPDSKPIVIPIEENNPKIVVTDGYHITKPLKLIYKDLHIYCFKVSCAINDRQLLIGLIALIILFLTGLFTGIAPIKAISFLPIIYLVTFYYLNRQDFIKLVPVLD